MAGLPVQSLAMSVGEQIEAIRGEWGKRLLILGHHYQRPGVLTHVDAIGDSLELARLAADAREAERIVFCGVHFMAETADMLTRPGQAVYMPDPTAGCPMADMATFDQMARVWAYLREHGDDWLPVVYVNSTASIKALCGQCGGSTCTSSNSAAVFRWVFDQGKRVFFLPDEHLGVNTAHDLGLPEESVMVCESELPDCGLPADRLAAARVVVWKGYCHVHTKFTVAQITEARAQMPGAQVIVHPECRRQVVRAADAHGSTAKIVEYVKAAPPGSAVLIGTEMHLVCRLAETHAGHRTVKALVLSVCANMAKTNEQNLLRLLQEWPDAHIVRVAPEVAADARVALQRMLDVS